MMHVDSNSTQAERFECLVVLQAHVGLLHKVQKEKKKKKLITLGSSPISNQISSFHQGTKDFCTYWLHIFKKITTQ